MRLAHVWDSVDFSIHELELLLIWCSCPVICLLCCESLLVTFATLSHIPVLLLQGLPIVICFTCHLCCAVLHLSSLVAGSPIVYPLSTPCLPLVYPLCTPCLPIVYPLSTPCLPIDYPLSTPCLLLVYSLSTLVYPLSTPCLPLVCPFFYPLELPIAYPSCIPCVPLVYPCFRYTVNSMQVACRPELPPLTVDTIPSNLASYARIGEALNPDDWEAVQAVTLQQAGYRCIATAMSCSTIEPEAAWCDARFICNMPGRDIKPKEQLQLCVLVIGVPCEHTLPCLACDTARASWCRTAL